MKYVVLKIDDVDRYCSFEQQDQIDEICNTIQSGRMRENKKAENRYIVINSDETYAPVIAEIMHLHRHTLGE